MNITAPAKPLPDFFSVTSDAQAAEPVILHILCARQASEAITTRNALITAPHDTPSHAANFHGKCKSGTMYGRVRREDDDAASH